MFNIQFNEVVYQLGIMGMMFFLLPLLFLRSVSFHFFILLHYTVPIHSVCIIRTHSVHYTWIPNKRTGNIKILLRLVRWSFILKTDGWINIHFRFCLELIMFSFVSVVCFFFFFLLRLSIRISVLYVYRNNNPLHIPTHTVRYAKRKFLS